MNLMNWLLRNRIFRYLISGGTAAGFDIGFLYILVRFFHLPYLPSVVAAFLAAFAISFTLQKFFTFSEDSVTRIPKEASYYFIVTLLNLVINTGLMYIFVSDLRIHYLISQFIVNGLLAIYSYFIYKYLIFYPISNAENQD